MHSGGKCNGQALSDLSLKEIFCIYIYNGRHHNLANGVWTMKYLGNKAMAGQFLQSAFWDEKVCVPWPVVTKRVVWQ